MCLRKICGSGEAANRSPVRFRPPTPQRCVQMRPSLSADCEIARRFCEQPGFSVVPPGLADSLFRMKIVSVKQPWAALIVSGAKDIENRTWSTLYRGPLLVHASLKPDPIASTEFEERFGVQPTGGPCGVVVGAVDLIDVVTSSRSRWFNGPYGWVLKNPRPLGFVPWRGSLGLRTVQPELLRLCGLADPVA